MCNAVSQRTQGRETEAQREQRWHHGGGFKLAEAGPRGGKIAGS